MVMRLRTIRAEMAGIRGFPAQATLWIKAWNVSLPNIRRLGRCGRTADRAQDQWDGRVFGRLGGADSC